MCKLSNFVPFCLHTNVSKVAGILLKTDCHVRKLFLTP